MPKKYYYIVGIVLVFVIIFLSLVFSGNIVLPQAISLGVFSIRWYGIILSLAGAAGVLVALARTNAYGIKKEQAENIFLLLLILGFIGARLWHVLTAYNYYLQNPVDIIKVWQGGLAIYGAILGGLVGLSISKKLLTTHYQLRTLLDWLTPSLIVGQVIGRFGNLFNYELYGYPTSLPWKMFVPIAFRDPQFIQSYFFHPLFLYESLGLAIILFGLIYLKNKGYFRADGILFFSYFFLYNILRFLIEFLRVDSSVWRGFRINFGISLILAVASFVCIIFLTHARKQT